MGRAESEDADPDERLVTCLAADELWAWGQQAGHLQAPVHLLAEAQEEARATASRCRRRQELRKQGVPREEWLDDLRTAPPQTPDAEVHTLGEGEAESPLARAMREALQGDT